MRLVPSVALVVVGVALGVLRSATPELAFFRAPGELPFLGWPQPKADFEALPGGVFRLDLAWWTTPWHRETLDLFALQLSGGGWALSDAGGYDTPLQRHASAVLAALLRLLESRGGSLRLVLLSHGHVDHVGALPLLLSHFPAAAVVCHEHEEAYLVRGQRYSPPWHKSSSRGLMLAHALGFLPRQQVMVGADRVALLRGASGDLAVHGAPEIHWAHTPGHAPSHVVWLHAPSRTLLGGDIADFLLAPLPVVRTLPDGRAMQEGRVYGYTMTGMHAANAVEAAASLCWMAFKLEGYDVVRPAHDSTKRGFSRAEVQALARDAAGCVAY